MRIFSGMVTLPEEGSSCPESIFRKVVFPMENINVQVYSLVSEPISPIEKLKTIAKLGFAGAEFTADFTEVPVEEMKKVLAENNLKVDSAHVGLDQIEGVLPYFAELGAKLVICPATNFCNKAEAEEVAAELNRLGNIAKQYGIKIGYHNHTDEFYVDEGKYLYDWLIDACDPEVTAFQLDCGWCSAAGVNPVDFINSHAGRIASIHIKENGGVIGANKPQSRHDTTPRFKFEKDADGKPIEGLYALGNCMGDITAVDYPINVAGNSHGRCITYGYLLGKDLAK